MGHSHSNWMWKRLSCPRIYWSFLVDWKLKRNTLHIWPFFTVEDHIFWFYYVSKLGKILTVLIFPRCSGFWLWKTVQTGGWMLQELTARILSFWTFSGGSTVNIFASDQIKTSSPVLLVKGSFFLVLSCYFVFDASQIKRRRQNSFGFKRRPYFKILLIILRGIWRSFAILFMLWGGILDNLSRTMSTSLPVRTLRFLSRISFVEIYPVSS